MPVKISASPPSQLWRSSHQLGRSLFPVARDEKKKPHTSAAIMRRVATIPLERVRYPMTANAASTYLSLAVIGDHEKELVVVGTI